MQGIEAVTKDEQHFERFAARLFLDDLEHGPEPERLPVTAMRITRYALGEGAVVDLDVEREIRRNPRARKLFLGLLDRSALGTGIEAAASSDDARRVFEVSGYRIEVVKEEDGTYIVVQLPDPNTRPSAIDVRSSVTGEGIRVDLPAPISRAIQLYLDPRDETLRRLEAALQQGDMTVRLL
jgi:hypothetical protein